MIVLITGGSSGLGESITRKLAQEPACTVYFTYHQSVDNAKKIEADFTNAIAIKCDFKNANEVDDLKNRIPIINPDVLINNAYSGSFMKAHFHKTPPDDFLSAFSENVIPALIITQACINCFRKRKSGKIITILTSALLNVPPAGASIYVANKAYLQKMTKVWAAENSKYNITSNTVSPSFMLTGFTKDTDERMITQMEENHPLKKILSTDEVAETVLYLIRASGQVNGIDIVINAATSIC